MLTFKLYDDKIILSSYAAAKCNTLKLKNDYSNLRDYSLESISRVKRKIYDYGISNNWTHFLTMTFDSKKIDRFNYLECKSKFIKYLKNYSRIDKDFKYLIIPELHKNGGIHFHGLVLFGESSLQHLRHFKKNIYNHKLFTKTFGFNRFIKIIDKSTAVISYIVKYISKDVQKIFRNYYFHSNNLKEPLKIKVVDNETVIEYIKKIEPLTCRPGLYFFQNNFVSTFVIDKTNDFYNYYYNKIYLNMQVER